jgi:Protein of unknown function (DUF4058)
VYLTHAQTRHAAKVWAVQLRERLPVVPVPLLQPDPDVILDLQAAVDSCFALVGYERLIDYRAALPPTDLGLAESAWVARQLAD